MLALCLMLLYTYYAQNYASIIGWCLTTTAEWSLNASTTMPTCIFKTKVLRLYTKAQLLKRLLHYSLTLPFTCSLHDVLCLQRPRPPNIGYSTTSTTI